MMLSASVLSADFGKLADEANAVERAGTDWVRVDVMDGHFVPNITVGPRAVEAVRHVTKLPLDVHLMIEHPEEYVVAFVEAGGDWIGFEVEAVTYLHRLVQNIKEIGAKATVVLNPVTSLTTIEDVLSDVDDDSLLLRFFHGPRCPLTRGGMHDTMRQRDQQRSDFLDIVVLLIRLDRCFTAGSWNSKFSLKEV